LKFDTAIMAPSPKLHMPPDPYIREKFTRESSTARGAVREYFVRFPKERYQTALETWRYLPSQTIEFTMKRLREPIEDGG
jgi:hypothetical protein